MHVVQFEQPVNGFAGLFLAGIDDVKHPAGFASDRRPQFGQRIGKSGVDGKAEGLDLLFRHATLPQHVRSGFVGHAEKVARRAEPRGIDGNGIGDDGDETEWALVMILVNLFDYVRINRVGRNDTIGLGFGQDLFECALQAREAAELFFDERIFQQ